MKLYFFVMNIVDEAKTDKNMMADMYEKLAQAELG